MPIPAFSPSTRQPVPSTQDAIYSSTSRVNATGCHAQSTRQPAEYNRRDATLRSSVTSPLYFYKTESCREKKTVLLNENLGYPWFVFIPVSSSSSLFLHLPPTTSSSPILPPSLFSLLSVVFHPSSVRDSPRKPLPFEVVRMSLPVSNRYHPNSFVNNSSLHKILSPR